MNYKFLLSLAAMSALALVTPQASQAATIFADTVIAYSGPAPYGGTYPGSFPVPVPLSYATDGDATTFVSLPRSSYITVGFSTGFVFDGVGLDLFISEVGGNDETANIFVSSDFGLTFTFLGVATTDTVSGFDLASIGYTGQVNAVKIVGLDNFGGSPGFDLAYVQGLEGSATVPDSMPTVWALGLVFLGFVAKRSWRTRHA